MAASEGKSTDRLVEHWPRVRAILDRALDLPDAERRAFVEARCEDPTLRAHVLSILLAYDDDAPALESPGFGPTDPAIHRLQEGDRVGAYRILEPIGHGGMGTVYRAERDDRSYQGQVAVKVLRVLGRERELIERFRRERQILADLEHPNIARLLDGGATRDGSPYLVMELIEGEPIDVFCRRRELAIEDRLRLFQQVCSAVQFAHQSLIVHRDLKPSNLLVTAEGVPKLLDFGIAKILAPASFAQTVAPTRTGWAPMTLHYASPEQVRGRSITTASDVYSLGVLLYELIVGEGPYRFDDGDLTSLLAAICDQEVQAPSVARRRGGGTSGPRRGRGLMSGVDDSDVDAIVEKAMAKDPARRYPTAAQLGEDIGRIFARRPVRARRPTWRYRTGKLIRRHRLALAAATTVFFVLAASVVVLALQQRRLIDQRDTALREQRRATTVTGWMTELFELPDPGRSMGETVTARALLDRSREAFPASEVEEPLLAAALLGTLGETYQNLGLLEEARESLTHAIDLYRSQPREHAAELSRRLRQLARVAAFEGHYREARQAARESLTQSERIPASIPASTPKSDARVSARELETVRSAALLGHVETLLGRMDEARALFTEAIPRARHLDEDETLARTLEYAAELHVALSEWTEAESRYREALEVRRAFQGPEHPEVALLESSLARVVSQLRPKQAEAMFRRAIDRQRAVLGDQHPILATALNNFAFWLAGQGRDDEAESHYAESLAIKRAVYGESHPKIAATLQNLGSRARQRGDLDRAENLIDQALDLYRRELGTDHPDYAMGLANKGMIQLLGRRHAAAEATLRQALTLLDASLGANHGRSTPVLLNLGEALRRQGDLASARKLFERAVEAAERTGGAKRQAVTARFNLATTAFQLEDWRAAAALFESVADDPSVGLYARTRLAAAYLALGQHDSAEIHGREAHDAWSARLDAPPWWRLSALRSHALALVRGGGDLDLAGRLLEDRRAEIEADFAGHPHLPAESRLDLEALASARRDGGTTVESSDGESDHR